MAEHGTFITVEDLEMEKQRAREQGFHEGYAQAMSEAQRSPRVMTLDEIADLEENQFIWIEENDSEEPIYCLEIIKMKGITSINMTIVLDTPSTLISVYTKDYNIKWRCWSSKPTKEQMEVAKWQ